MRFRDGLALRHCAALSFGRLATRAELGAFLRNGYSVAGSGLGHRVVPCVRTRTIASVAPPRAPHIGRACAGSLHIRHRTRNTNASFGAEVEPIRRLRGNKKTPACEHRFVASKLQIIRCSAVSPVKLTVPHKERCFVRLASANENEEISSEIGPIKSGGWGNLTLQCFHEVARMRENFLNSADRSTQQPHISRRLLRHRDLALPFNQIRRTNSFSSAQTAASGT